jgi:hypothetical protein
MIPALGFIIFGWPLREKDYGAAYPHYCTRCENQTISHLFKQRRWFSLFFIPVIPLSRGRYWMLCEICGAGNELSRSQAKAAKPMVEATRAYANGNLSREAYVQRIQGLEPEVFDEEDIEWVEVPDYRSVEVEEYCSECESPLTSGYEYCPHCGTAVTGDDVTEATGPEEIDTGGVDPEELAKRRKERKGKR